MFFYLCHIEKAAVLLLLGMIASTIPVRAQLPIAIDDQAETSAPRSRATDKVSKLTFEVASVRHSSQEFSVKGGDFLNPVGRTEPPPGGLFSWNVTLPWLINFAYDLRSSQERRGAREALPKWAQDDWYSIEARADGNPTRDDVRRMVRSLLEVRFQFVANIERREGQVYALVVVKQSSELKPHPEGTPCTLPSSEISEKKYPQAYPSYKEIPAHCGIFNRELSRGGEHRLEMLNVTMQQIAESLGLILPLLVVDTTGLAGRFDAVLDFGSNPDPSITDSLEAIDLPPLPSALEKQLGLKLVKQNANVDALAIDHIARLLEN